MTIRKMQPRHAAGNGNLRLVPSPEPGNVLLALKEGHPAAAAAVFRQYAPLVRRILLYTLGGHRDVDDLVQDSFERLFMRLDRVESEDKVQAFLSAIAANVAREELKRRRVRRILQFGFDSQADGANTPLAPTADLDAREAVRRLYAALDALNASDRAAFVLRFIEGMELTEVADALSMSVATVKRRLSRAQQGVLRRTRTDPWLGSFVAAWNGRLVNASE